jgi:Flp pilus assembly protein TadG
MIRAGRNILARFRAFSRDRAANVALTFGIATLPILGAVGAAVDFSRANDVKSAMQSALDATALMLSRDAATLASTDLNTKAQNYFLAMFVRPEAKDVTVTASYSQGAGSQVIVNGTAKVPTAIMGIVGYNEINISGSSTTKWGSERLRVALALDNTGSMADDGKMSALKDATKSLLTQLKNASSTTGDVYVSIIPFSKDVSVNGSSNYSQSWIDWTDWNDSNGDCSKNSRRREYATKSACQAANGNWTTDNHNTWNGCITDRGDVAAPNSSNYDQKVTAPSSSITASRFPAENYGSCPANMLGLTYDWTSLNSLVDDMSPNGSTNQPIGLVWAWQSLVGGGPLTAPAKDSNYTYKDIIILMSDGLNTQDRWYGNGSSTSTSVDNRMYDSTNGGAGTCANAKAAGVTIYSIQVNTGGDPTSTIMQNCATSSDKFYEVKSSGDLGTVFSAIGTNLTKLRVAK